MDKLQVVIAVSLILGIILLALMASLLYLMWDFSQLEKALSIIVIGQMFLLIISFIYFIVDAKHDVRMAELQREALMKRSGGAYHYSPQFTETAGDSGPSWRPGAGLLGLGDDDDI